MVVELVDGREEREAEPRPDKGVMCFEDRWVSRVAFEALMSRVTLQGRGVRCEGVSSYENGQMDAQNVAVTEDGSEVVLEGFERSELFAPCIYGVCVTLEGIVCTREEVDDGSDGVGGRGRRCGCVGGERGEGSMGERKESSEVFGVFLLVGDEVGEQARVGRAVDHDKVVVTRKRASHMVIHTTPLQSIGCCHIGSTATTGTHQTTPSSRTCIHWVCTGICTTVNTLSIESERLYARSTAGAAVIATSTMLVGGDRVYLS